MDSVPIPAHPVDTPRGTLGVLIAGLGGTVATTFLAGLFAARDGRALPIGSLTQLGMLPAGDAGRRGTAPIRERLPLATLEDLAFGGWDVRDDSCFDAALGARVLEERDLLKVRHQLEELRPFPAVVDPAFATRGGNGWTKKGRDKADLAEQLRADIRRFATARDVRRLVVLWCGNDEPAPPPSAAHASPAAFEHGMRRNDPSISPSMLYAWAALREGAPFIDGTAAAALDVPALRELARARQLPLAGKDFKSPATLIKSVIGPLLRARMLGLRGWFSENIRGGARAGGAPPADDAPRAVLQSVLQPERYPALYGDYYHKVHLHYYPPAGETREGWDSVDLFGWLGYPMQLKVDFVCRDAILAAPLVLDLILLIDLARRAGLTDVQDWLAFYFNQPMTSTGARAEFDHGRQAETLMRMLEKLSGAGSGGSSMSC